MPIQFRECHIAGYPARTEENVRNSDVTLAFAIDFNSAGEKLTKRLCIKHNKPYIPISLVDMDISFNRIMRIVSFMDNKLADKSVVINIAGNGIYSLPKEQIYYNEWMYKFLEELIGRSSALFTIIGGRTGGQTGIDEAGAVALSKLDLPTIVYAPKGFIFREKDHKDISNEQLFKQRFI